MIKKIASMLVVILGLASFSWGQSSVKIVTKSYGATGATAAFNAAGFGAHTIKWTKSGTVSGCTIEIQSATTYGGSYATLGAAQTCTSSGTYTYYGSANFVKLNMTSWTGTGTVIVTYYGVPQWFSNMPGAVYSNAGVEKVGAWHTVVGTCTLGTDCAVTLTAPAAFTGTTTYWCTATDNTAAAAVKIVNTAAGTVTLTGTGTDVLTYVCVGY